MQNQVSPSEAMLRKYPEQVVIGIAKDPQGKPNPIALGWTMITSRQPPMMAVSIGKTRYSLEAFQQAGEFVISFPSRAMAEETLYFGNESGREHDKLAEKGTATQPAEEIDSVLLTDAVANFELKLSGEMETGDHVIFAGEIVAAHVHADDTLQRLYTVGPNHTMGGVTPIERQ
jgi:flavin reductase (DIM6/NTAB) family NADH-FMN oxidoreductase RutF